MCRVMGFYAQDSLDCVSVRPCAVDETHSVKLAEVLVPVAVAGVSALYVDNGWQNRSMVCRMLFRGKASAKFPLTTIYSIRPWWLSTDSTLPELKVYILLRTVLLSLPCLILQWAFL